jgi:hypothetical protein
MSSIKKDETTLDLPTLSDPTVRSEFSYRYEWMDGDIFYYSIHNYKLQCVKFSGKKINDNMLSL